MNSTFTKPEDFLVHGLEQKQAAYATFQGSMYAGMLPSDNGERTGNTMFWMFQPDTQEVPDSIVLWLNGGPGCSSFNCGIMMEHSPVVSLHCSYCIIRTDIDNVLDIFRFHSPTVCHCLFIYIYIPLHP